MSIRASNNTKNHSSQHNSAQSTVTELPSASGVLDDPLRFFTHHPHRPRFVDLTTLRDGEKKPPARNGDRLGTFRGRPELIGELAPAIRDQVVHLAPHSVTHLLNSVRTWWRLFDAMEAADAGIQVVASVAHLTDLHRQYAHDSEMDREAFSVFLRLVNITRAALGLRRLHWDSPEKRDVNRHLPPQWQTNLVRHKLKHRWLAAVERWEIADALREKGTPLVNRKTDAAIYEEQARLLHNYQYFDAVIARTGHARPSQEQFFIDVRRSSFYRRGLNMFEMVRGSYPDSDDIRAAFHLCLATTGWNPAVLLSLDVNEACLESHPKNPSRYVLRGRKARAGGSEQVTEGLFKTRGGAGFILRTLMERTAPLREQLNNELLILQARLEGASESSGDVVKIRKRVMALREAVRSPWLCVSRKFRIHWLHDRNFSHSVEKVTSSYLRDFIIKINECSPEDKKISLFTASDLRDAYAANVYRASGGSVLAVMKALGHRHVKTTSIYLNNNLLRDEHRKLFDTFSWALWEKAVTHGRIDSTVLAHWSRYGEVTPEHSERLCNYRELLRSRLGIGCKDPLHPPKHIAPDFEPDGESMCSVQRCTLCTENAVIFPESLPGLCKRLVELRQLRASMGVGAFLESSFLTELENTELALLAFDADEVAQQIRTWEGRVASGAHRIIQFDGSEGQ